MKRLLCCILTLIALFTFAVAEETAESASITFEDGFTLSLPADWVCYEVDPALAEDGFIYCLGSADGERLMYIQRWATDIDSLESLASYLDTREEIELRFTAAEATNGFLMYNFTGIDCSGCATLMEDSILNLLFLPQSDSESMLIAATVLESFTIEE